MHKMSEMLMKPRSKRSVFGFSGRKSDLSPTNVPDEPPPLSRKRTSQSLPSRIYSFSFGESKSPGSPSAPTIQYDFGGPDFSGSYHLDIIAALKGQELTALARSSVAESLRAISSRSQMKLVQDEFIDFLFGSNGGLIASTLENNACKRLCCHPDELGRLLTASAGSAGAKCLSADALVEVILEQVDIFHRRILTNLLGMLYPLQCSTAERNGGGGTLLDLRRSLAVIFRDRILLPVLTSENALETLVVEKHLRLRMARALALFVQETIPRCQPRSSWWNPPEAEDRRNWERLLELSRLFAGLPPIAKPGINDRKSQPHSPNKKHADNDVSDKLAPKQLQRQAVDSFLDSPLYSSNSIPATFTFDKNKKEMQGINENKSPRRKIAPAVPSMPISPKVPLTQPLIIFTLNGDDKAQIQHDCNSSATHVPIDAMDDTVEKLPFDGGLCRPKHSDPPLPGILALRKLSLGEKGRARTVPESIMDPESTAYNSTLFGGVLRKSFCSPQQQKGKDQIARKKSVTWGDQQQPPAVPSPCSPPHNDMKNE